jgi:hypothetical protein
MHRGGCSAQNGRGIPSGSAHRRDRVSGRAAILRGDSRGRPFVRSHIGTDALPVRLLG